MSVHDDDVQGYALGAVFGIVALVVAGVLALACFKTLQSPASSSVFAAGSGEHIYFDADADALPAEANEVLMRMADAARQDDRVLVLIIGVYGRADEAALMQRRTLRVRHALEANGVSPSQLVLGKPLYARAGDAKAARRVDVLLQP
jgi:outer membrane protein OmpA-like peptidoglycan-associated protein